jgi:hypothetical protein
MAHPQHAPATLRPTRSGKTTRSRPGPRIELPWGAALDPGRGWRHHQSASAMHAGLRPMHRHWFVVALGRDRSVWTIDDWFLGLTQPVRLTHCGRFPGIVAKGWPTESLSSALSPCPSGSLFSADGVHRAEATNKSPVQPPVQLVSSSCPAHSPPKIS